MILAAELNEQLWWYVARSSGFVSWAAVTLSVLWGLALSTKLMGKKAAPTWLLDVHRFLGALSVVFIGVHLVALVGDSYVYFGWKELFVPMASRWQPGAVAWGIVAFYLLIAVQITSLLMNRIPRRLWRWIHFTSFAVYGLSTVHVIESGTDVTNPVFRYSALASVQLVLFMLGVRLVTTRRLKRALREQASQTATSADPSKEPAPTVDASREERLAALRARRAMSGAMTPQQRPAAAPDDASSPTQPEEPAAAAVDDQLAARVAALKQRRESGCRPILVNQRPGPASDNIPPAFLTSAARVEERGTSLRQQQA